MINAQTAATEKSTIRVAIIVVIIASLSQGCEGQLIGPLPAHEPGSTADGGLAGPNNPQIATPGLACTGLCPQGNLQAAPGGSQDSDMPAPDKGALAPDSKPPKPAKADAFVPKPDAFVPKPDAFVPKPDSGVPPPSTGGTIYYVRPGGGSLSQCTGKANKDYSGSGTSQACAIKHPFYLLPPSGKAIFKGGDTMVIASGKYRMGVGAPGDVGCDKAFAWDCYMADVPSGTAKTPTRILGQGWNSGCQTAPQLYGVERTDHVLSLDNANHIQIQCLEITDHSSCVEFHSGKLSCKRGGYPNGDWAALGLQASDSSDVLLKHVDIHGMAASGILAGRLKNWTVEDSKINGNGWVGWDGDLQSKTGSSNSGYMNFRRTEISWNGCGETYPGRKPTGCWGQGAGGYGDGMGTAATGGDWLFEDCQVMHNTSDGIDLLYHSLGGKITIRRMRAEGNAGNQLKVSGNAHIENSVLVGNCAYFQGKSFTHNVDHCRALGNTLAAFFTTGAKITVVNSTLFGNGDVLLMSGHRGNTACNGTEQLIAVNNIFLGGKEYHAPSENAAAFYTEDCKGLKLQESYGIVHNVKGGCALGTNDLCADPKLGPLSGDLYGMIPAKGSPAIDSGKAVGGIIPSDDFMKLSRPLGKGVERGACEVAP